MNALDAVIVALAVLAAVGGYRVGFLSRVMGWIGLVAGVALVHALLPRLVEGSDADPRLLVVVSAGLLIGAGVLGQALGVLAGRRLHIGMPAEGARQADRVAGAVAGVVAVAAIAWMLTPAMADISGWPARQARGSAIAGALADRLPEPPDASRVLRQLLGDDFPRVFEGLDRTGDVPPPPAESGLDAETAQRISASTVRLTGDACGAVHVGSGFVVRPGLVATNAHVVAGEVATTVESDTGVRLEGRVVAFDPVRDVALVQVPGLEAPALPLREAEVGDRGAVFGHPGGSPLRLAPFEVDRIIRATGSDIYDRSGAEREVLVVAASLQPGDSGSPLVTPEGEVVGMTFAIAPDRDGVAYALDTSEVEAVVRAAGTQPVVTGPCIR